LLGFILFASAVMRRVPKDTRCPRIDTPSGGVRGGWPYNELMDISATIIKNIAKNDYQAAFQSLRNGVP
jgi:hypothetical protein